jgi:glucan phosphoethanolaminetransferase (alkaline phosphatase superfamily)
MLLIPIVTLKLASTGWRALRYYTHAAEYVEHGPPHIALRVLVAPVVVLSTIVLFATGVLLLILDRTQGLIVGLHKASFVVWVIATGLHVLAHILKLPRLLRTRAPGVALRATLAAAGVAVGMALAVATLPAADHLQDRASSHLGLDKR